MSNIHDYTIHNQYNLCCTVKTVVADNPYAKVVYSALVFQCIGCIQWRCLSLIICGIITFIWFRISEFRIDHDGVDEINKDQIICNCNVRECASIMLYYIVY